MTFKQRSQFHPGDRVNFSHCDGFTPAEVVAVKDNKVQLRIHKWLGKHWFPESTISQAIGYEHDGITFGDQTW